LKGLDYTARVYGKQKAEKRKKYVVFLIEQKFWIRVSGNIRDRLNIDVGYSNASGEKDISFIYKGQPGKFIQEAVFFETFRVLFRMPNS